MMILLHILIGISSLVAVGIALVRPSHPLLALSAGLSALTIISGGALLIMGSSIVHVCVSGGIFTTLAILGIIVAEQRMISQQRT